MYTNSKNPMEEGGLPCERGTAVYLETFKPLKKINLGAHDNNINNNDINKNNICLILLLGLKSAQQNQH